MMPSRGLRWTGNLLHTSKRCPGIAPRLGKRFSTRTPPSSVAHAPTPRRPCIPYNYQAKSFILPLTAARFASTVPNDTLTIPVAAPSDKTPPVDSVAAPSSEFTPTTFDDVLNSELPLLPEHIGYLKDLGLDYGWGPTAFIETLLEHVHVYTGTPWWASILLTAFVIRLALIKGYIGASDTSARLAVLTPVIDPIKKRLDAAKDSKDPAALVAIQSEIWATYRAGGVKFWKMAVPLIQIPLGYGTFRLMRGMAALPVPGLEDGGFLWLKDLTLADPFFLLPVLTSAAFHYTFKKGGELGSYGTTMSPALRNFFIYGLPLMSGALMLFWPACMQLSFFFTSLFSMSQSWLLRQAWMRDWLGIQALPKIKRNPRGTTSPYSGTMSIYKPPSNAPPQEKKNMIQGAISDIKSTFSEAASKARGMAARETKSTTRRTAAELRQAKAYEERRRKEMEDEKVEREDEKKQRQKRAKKGKNRNSP